LLSGVLVAARFLAGCSGEVQDNTGAPDGAGADAASDSGLPGFDSGPLPEASPSQTDCPSTLPSCPATAPEAGAPCTAPSGFRCEYGNDPEQICDVVASCDPSHGWQVELPDVAQGFCPTTLPPWCPPTFADALDSGSDCPQGASSPQCEYPEGICFCTAIRMGQPYELACPGLSSTCPNVRPRLGTPCAIDGGCLVVGACWMREECTCGTWQPIMPCIPHP
jgi:hypothetical protein